MIRIPGTGNMEFYIQQYKIQEDMRLRQSRRKIVPITGSNTSNNSLHQQGNNGVYYNDRSFSEILAEQAKKRK